MHRHTTTNSFHPQTEISQLRLCTVEKWAPASNHERRPRSISASIHPRPFTCADHEAFTKHLAPLIRPKGYRVVEYPEIKLQYCLPWLLCIYMFERDMAWGSPVSKAMRPFTEGNIDRISSK